MKTKKVVREKTGDGLAFYQAFKLSGKTAEDVYTAMDISNGTLYNLFNSASIEDVTKEQAAKAIGKKKGDVFGDFSNKNKGDQTTTIEQTMPDYQAEYLEIIRNCSEAARDSAYAAKESAQAVNKLIPASSSPTLEEKVDHIYQTLAAEKVGQVAVQTLLLREIAKRDGRKYEDVYNEFLDNELAEAAGVRTKANTHQGRENVGRKDKARQTS